jgi:RHS repeat-associated protein
LFYFNRQWQCVEEYVGSTCNVRFVWGLRYVDDLVTYRNVSTDYYVLQDANWNVVGLTNTSGVVQERYTYSSFGKLNVFDASFTPKSASTYNLTRSFTGQLLDSETGLMLYRHRVYHPTVGRFIQRDPIGYDAGDENLMRYVGNNPLYRVDSNGWQGWSISPIGTLELPPIQDFPVEQLYPSIPPLYPSVPPPPPGVPERIPSIPDQPKIPDKPKPSEPTPIKFPCNKDGCQGGCMKFPSRPQIISHTLSITGKGCNGYDKYKPNTINNVLYFVGKFPTEEDACSSGCYCDWSNATSHTGTQTVEIDDVMTYNGFVCKVKGTLTLKGNFTMAGCKK